MNLSDFDYDLPNDLIAQTPIEKRDQSRLMVINKDSNVIEHCVFSDIALYLKKGDTLVLNDTKVIPARLIGVKEMTNAVIEILLLENISGNIWTSLVKPAKRVKKGTVITFGNGQLSAKCIDILDEGIRKFELIYEGIFNEILDCLGAMPLPPYIHEKLDDKSRYQTVYAKNIGSSAAPTAGLHFTVDLLNKLKENGVNISYITLHVGLGTFRPVVEEDITKHKMHSEYYSMSEETANVLNETKSKGNKIIAVGTTSVRTLETIMNKYGKFVPSSGKTDIFIYPGYKFLGVDEMITNFHLPKSTLLMLVSAFASKKLILDSYHDAISNKYRFFSFGDAMYIRTNRE